MQVCFGLQAAAKIVSKDMLPAVLPVVGELMKHKRFVAYLLSIEHGHYTLISISIHPPIKLSSIVPHMKVSIKFGHPILKFGHPILKFGRKGFLGSKWLLFF